jgi:hypothetical protein
MVRWFLRAALVALVLGLVVPSAEAQTVISDSTSITAKGVMYELGSVSTKPYGVAYIAVGTAQYGGGTNDTLRIRLFVSDDNATWLPAGKDVSYAIVGAQPTFGISHDTLGFNGSPAGANAKKNYEPYFFPPLQYLGPYVQVRGYLPAAATSTSLKVYIKFVGRPD